MKRSATFALVIDLFRRLIAGIAALSLLCTQTYSLYVSAGATVSGVFLLSSRAMADDMTTSGNDGSTFGRGLLTGPNTDGTRIFYNGSSGTASINTSDLFTPAGSNNDAADMLAAFGDSPSAAALIARVNSRLSGENSEQARAVDTVRSSALSRSHPDLINDPSLARSKDIMAGTDPIFASFLDACTDTTTTSPGRGVHVPKPEYCTRVMAPSEHCQIDHTYTVASTKIVEIASGPGRIEGCGPGCLDIYVGNAVEDYFGGSHFCATFNEATSIQVLDPSVITSAVVRHVGYDDFFTFSVNGLAIWDTGPPSAAHRRFGCDLRVNNRFDINSDITPMFQTSPFVNASLRTIVGGGGEGYAIIRINYNGAGLLTSNVWSAGPECASLFTGIANGVCTDVATACTAGPVVTSGCISIDQVMLCEPDIGPSPYAGVPPFCNTATIDADCHLFEGSLTCYTDMLGRTQCPTNSGGYPNGCSTQEANPNCAFVSSTCLPFATDGSGGCYAFQEEWDCGFDTTIPGSTTTSTVCAGPIRCMGEECVSQPRESNPDFGRAAATLSAVDWMAQNMTCASADASSCEIFKGEALECKKALGGYKDCCALPVSVSLSDYLQLAHSTYKLGKMVNLAGRLQAAGLNAPGAWTAIKNFGTETWSTITKPFTSAWESVAQQFGGSALSDVSTVSLSSIQGQLWEGAGELVANLFGEDAKTAIFQTNSSGSATGFSGPVASALNVIMWVYTIYVILDTIIAIVFECEEDEFMLASKKELLACTYVGSYCANDSPFGCIEAHDTFCCYNSPLARIVMSQAGVQLGRTMGDAENPVCTGISVAELALLDWDAINLDEWFGILAANGMIPDTEAAFNSKWSVGTITSEGTPPNPNLQQRIDQRTLDLGSDIEAARDKIRTDLW